MYAMNWTFFAKKPRQKVASAAPKRAVDNTAVYHALCAGLEKLKTGYADAVVLALYEADGDPSVVGRWIDMNETRYYPFEILPEAEQEMIRSGKTYERVALVMPDVCGVRGYPTAGVETFKRTHIHPLLPKLIPESQLKYVTTGSFAGEEQLQDFVRSAAKSGWAPETIDKAVSDGLAEYRGITRRLMEQGGVMKALGEMEQRQCSPSEQIFADLRNQVAKARGDVL